jgi:hypothetical protein
VLVVPAYTGLSSICADPAGFPAAFFSASSTFGPEHPVSGVADVEAEQRLAADQLMRDRAELGGALQRALSPGRRPASSPERLSRPRPVRRPPRRRRRRTRPALVSAGTATASVRLVEPWPAA